MSAVADKLREARALIERGWTQGQWARGKSGRPVRYNSRFAVCWCSSGAQARAFGKDWEGYQDAKEMFFAAIEHSNIAVWNDAPERTQAEVLAAFDKAIELAEAEQ